MIIFYQKSTGRIFGVIEGRVHDKNTIEKSFIRPSNIKKKDIGKWVVPYKKNPDKDIGGLVPDVKFSDKIFNFESGKESPYDYKVILKDGKVIGFTPIN